MNVYDKLKEALQRNPEVTVGDAIKEIIVSDGFTYHKELGENDYLIRVIIPQKQANANYKQRIWEVVKRIESMVNDGIIVLTNKREDYGSAVKLARIGKENGYVSYPLCFDNERKIWNILSSQFELTEKRPAET